ncbi:hypothetical protein, partial [Parvimonas micra]|uniref:hypothetical protein n=1 Tax=Parvimonas micra TaxID=33033 RepID=UPI002B49239F
MARVTTQELADFLDIPVAAKLQGYIDDANLLVSETLASSGQSDARLKLIEKNLSAHFYTVALERGGLTQKTIGESQ